MNSHIGNGKNEGYDNGQQPHDIGLIILGKHLAGGDIAEALTQNPLSLHEQNAGKGYGYGIQRGIGILKAVLKNKAGVTDEGPTRKTGSGGSQDKNPDRNAPAGNKIIGSGLDPKCSLYAAKNAVGAVHGDKYKQPDFGKNRNSFHCLFFWLGEVYQPGRNQPFPDLGNNGIS